MTDYFFLAIKNKYRFPSSKGNLTAEQLWDLPLSSVNNPNLDAIAKDLSRTIRSFEEESFVATAPKTGLREAQHKLEIVKAVIADKLAAVAAAENRARKSALRAQITEALANKQAASLSAASEAELLQRLRELED